MKICFFTSSISLSGGTERVCLNIANKLASLGYEISILSFYGDKSYFPLDERVKTLKLYDKKYSFSLFAPIVAMKLRSVIKEINPDVLISVDAALFVYSFFSTFCLKIRRIVWEHFNFTVTLDAKIRVMGRKLAAKFAETVIVLTKRDKELWLEGLNCKCQIVVINNPTPFEISYVSEPRQNIILSVGRFTSQKGFDRLLKIWKLIQDSGITNWVLKIVGSGELQQLLNSQIISLNIENSAFLIPATTDIQSHYKQAQIYAMTSRFEGFPMVLLEAQSFGLPMVAFDCLTGPAEIIIDNRNGLLVEDGDINTFAEKLITVMQNSDMRRQMSDHALESGQKYQLKNIITHWIDLLK